MEFDDFDDFLFDDYEDMAEFDKELRKREVEEYFNRKKPKIAS
nr:hypothetical protein [uncultured archaeon]